MNVKAIAALVTIAALGFASGFQARGPEKSAKAVPAVLQKIEPVFHGDVLPDSTLSILIDVPTGFVFVYTLDGWKLVHRLGNESG